MSEGETNRSLRFRGHVVIGGVLECVSGLHIGGNRDSLAAGLDLPVARDPATRRPIVPGSSLKGRLRSLMQMLRGAGGEDGLDPVALLFGSPASRRRGLGPTRSVVRDGRPMEATPIPGEGATVDWWQLLDSDGFGTELKAETSVNRITASAQPRQVERVVAGSRFQLEFVLSVFDSVEGEERLVKDLVAALRLLEDSYLGGHGSRGYGKVRIRLHADPGIVTARDYEQGSRTSRVAHGELKDLEEIDAEAWVNAIGERLRAGEA